MDKRFSEKSFTLLETIIALGIMVTIILEVSSVQGNAINFNSYAQKSTQAAWLAKSIMSEIEYKAGFYPLKDMKTDPTMKDRPISESLCPKDNINGCDYTYTVTIEDFKLPIIDIMLGGSPSSDSTDDKDKSTEANPADDTKDPANPLASMIQEKVKEILGDEVLKIAKVEVFWPEGAVRNSVYTTLLLANQLALDTYIEQLPPLKDAKIQCPPGQVPDKEGKCIIGKPDTPPPPPDGKPILPNPDKPHKLDEESQRDD